MQSVNKYKTLVYALNCPVPKNHIWKTFLTICVILITLKSDNGHCADQQSLQLCFFIFCCLNQLQNSDRKLPEKLICLLFQGVTNTYPTEFQFFYFQHSFYCTVLCQMYMPNVHQAADTKRMQLLCCSHYTPSNVKTPKETSLPQQDHQHLEHHLHQHHHHHQHLHHQHHIGTYHEITKTWGYIRISLDKPSSGWLPDYFRHFNQQSSENKSSTEIYFRFFFSHSSIVSPWF